MEEILGIIPARGGSKGIPHKNIVNLCGKPLIQYTFEAAQNAKKMTRFLVSTEDRGIKEFSQKKNVEVIDRPEWLAKDTTSTASVIEYTLNYLEKAEGYNPEYVMILQPTSPLRYAEDIDNCITLIKEKNADSVVSVVDLPHNFLPEKLMKIEDDNLRFLYDHGENYTTRQQQRKLYARNGAAIYLFKTIVFKETKSYYGKKCIPYVMEKSRSFDIDTLEDLEIVRAWINYQGKKNNNAEKDNIYDGRW